MILKNQAKETNIIILKKYFVLKIQKVINLTFLQNTFLCILLNNQHTLMH